MPEPSLKIKHPHITINKKICGNSPFIKETRTTVRPIVNYYKQGLSPEEINSKLSYLKLAEIYDALAFYYDNKEYIEKEIEDNNNETKWEQEIICNAE
jgi:uncharacterized protein (DUF433 family)